MLNSLILLYDQQFCLRDWKHINYLILAQVKWNDIVFVFDENIKFAFFTLGLFSLIFRPELSTGQAVLVSWYPVLSCPAARQDEGRNQDRAEQNKNLVLCSPLIPILLSHDSWNIFCVIFRWRRSSSLCVKVRTWESLSISIEKGC